MRSPCLPFAKSEKESSLDIPETHTTVDPVLPQEWDASNLDIVKEPLPDVNEVRDMQKHQTSVCDWLENFHE